MSVTFGLMDCLPLLDVYPEGKTIPLHAFPVLYILNDLCQCYERLVTKQYLKLFGICAYTFVGATFAKQLLTSRTNSS